MRSMCMAGIVLATVTTGRGEPFRQTLTSVDRNLNLESWSVTSRDVTPDCPVPWSVRKYRSWMFDDWGNRGEGWMTFDDDGKTGHTQATMIAPTGARTRSVGTMTFVDDDTLEWEFTEKGPMGTMKLEGTMKREP